MKPTTSTGGCLLAPLLIPGLLDADTIRWRQHVDGDWNDGTRWTNLTSGAFPVVPGPEDAVDISQFYVTSTQAVVSLTHDMYPGGVTNLSWLLSSAYSSIARSYQLLASGTAGSPLRIHLTGPAANTLRISRGHELVLNHVALTISGAIDHSLYVRDRIASLPFTMRTEQTDIVIPDAPAGKGFYLTSDGYMSNDPQYFGRVSMSGGSLTVTNPAGSALLTLAGAAPGEGFTLTADTITALWLSNTLFTVNDASALSFVRFRVNNAELTATSQISRVLLIDDGARVEFNGGFFAVSNVDYGAIVAGRTGTAMIVNGATGTIGTVTMRNNNVSYEPVQFIVSNGTVTIDNVYLGASTQERNFQEFRMAGGSAQVLGSTILGRDNLNTRHGSGLLTFTDGAFESGNVTIGTLYADGYYEQTGGTATITNLLTLRTDTSTYGASQFVVGSNATLTLTGPGFAKAGTTAWLAGLLTPTNLAFAGSLVFAPASGVMNQTLLAFGQDVGNDRAGLTNDFAMATLDLSALDGEETLTVTPAGNQTPNALYIKKLLGLTPATAAARLISDLSLYYDPLDSPTLGPGQTISLTGGGYLIALPSPRTLGTLMQIL